MKPKSVCHITKQLCKLISQTANLVSKSHKTLTPVGSGGRIGLDINSSPSPILFVRCHFQFPISITIKPLRERIETNLQLHDPQNIWNSTWLEVRFDAPKRLGNFRDFSFFLWFTPKKHHKKGIDGGKYSPSLLTSNIWQPFLCFLKTISGFTIYEKKLPPTSPPQPAGGSEKLSSFHSSEAYIFNAAAVPGLKPRKGGEDDQWWWKCYVKNRWIFVLCVIWKSENVINKWIYKWIYLLFHRQQIFECQVLKSCRFLSSKFGSNLTHS